MSLDPDNIVFGIDGILKWSLKILRTFFPNHCWLSDFLKHENELVLISYSIFKLVEGIGIKGWSW